jgi:hypothetical protein
MFSSPSIALPSESLEAASEEGIADAPSRHLRSNLAHSPLTTTRTTQHPACAFASTGACRNAIWICSGQLHAFVTAALAVLIANHAESGHIGYSVTPVATHIVLVRCGIYENL